MPTAQAEQNITLAVLVNIASTPLGAASIDCELLHLAKAAFTSLSTSRCYRRARRCRRSCTNRSPRHVPDLMINASRDDSALNASSGQLHVSGAAHRHTKARPIATKPGPVGSTTTTGIELVTPSAAKCRWLDLPHRETSSRRFTTSKLRRAAGVEQSKDVNSRCPSHVALRARVDDIIDNLTEIMSSLRLCPKQSRQFASYAPLNDRRGMIYIRFSVCESFSRDAPPRTRPGGLHGRWRLGRY